MVPRLVDRTLVIQIPASSYTVTKKEIIIIIIIIITLITQIL